ncbi:MAG: hypothetical protein AB7O30_09135 [Dehalococcoidia bacterium]
MQHDAAGAYGEYLLGGLQRPMNLARREIPPKNLGGGVFREGSFGERT